MRGTELDGFPPTGRRRARVEANAPGSPKSVRHLPALLGLFSALSVPLGYPILIADGAVLLQPSVAAGFGLFLIRGARYLLRGDFPRKMWVVFVGASVQAGLFLAVAVAFQTAGLPRSTTLSLQGIFFATAAVGKAPPLPPHAR